MPSTIFTSGQQEPEEPNGSQKQPHFVQAAVFLLAEIKTYYYEDFAAIRQRIMDEQATQQGRIANPQLYIEPLQGLRDQVKLRHAATIVVVEDVLKIIARGKVNEVHTQMEVRFLQEKVTEMADLIDQIDNAVYLLQQQRPTLPPGQPR